MSSVLHRYRELTPSVKLAGASFARERWALQHGVLQAALSKGEGGAMV